MIIEVFETLFVFFTGLMIKKGVEFKGLRGFKAMSYLYKTKSSLFLNDKRALG